MTTETRHTCAVCEADERITELSQALFMAISRLETIEETEPHLRVTEDIARLRATYQEHAKAIV